MALKRKTRTARSAAAGVAAALRGPELASETVAARERQALAPEQRCFGKDQNVFLPPPAGRQCAGTLPLTPSLPLYQCPCAFCPFISSDSLGQQPRPSRDQAEATGNRETPST